jgi:excisionase family DNA binding protein
VSKKQVGIAGTGHPAVDVANRKGFDHESTKLLTVGQTPRGLRVPDAAQYAGVSHWFIRSAVWNGKLRARRAGKVIIILRDDLDEFLNSLPEVQPNTAEWLADRQCKAVQP